ncbi:type II toxin-antitoxin system BrnA family antitoxin [Methylotenera sp.]|uniref:type II toxin-antitoxin system BrnA family antitoxin n=2 Tax=Methylotenera sp. TaxID=2051956 RepID=UPI00271D7D83|nr:CopG family antitoxin [Methylotenera sp.]MDO9206290.1 CopG family antitoxin [Methylotenera sp.]MDO9393434.1 CopG family antitoxin [Methylotenera sp.]MDP2070455.1 CopG family antitoxin [Methylotenera sp.]MDP3006269.1 CopG family antitoxin [Methylotenera sp.]MDP3819667.1 CopG family antitoxin [Methylotenera sp.]
MKAKNFEKQFDEDVDITALLDLSKAKRVLQEQKRVNVDFPTWMVESLDREAGKLGVTRQSVIKVWLAERLEKSALTHPSSGTR